MNRRNLVILVGAHKTASSHLQHSLLGSQRALAEHGIAVIGPKTMRQDLTPMTRLIRDGMTPEVVQAAGHAFLDYHGGDAETIVLMDENILGGTERKMLLRRARIYPNAPYRIKRLTKIFEGHNLQIGLATRNPASFLPSCWGESLRHGETGNFEDYVADFDPTLKIWTGLLQRVAKRTGDIPITLWRYEDYRTLGPALFTQLFKKDVTEAVTPEAEVRRPGLSQRAADWFQAQEKRNKATSREARRLFPKEGGEKAFSPWSDEQIATLTESYERDIAKAQTIDSVALVRPVTQSPVTSSA